MSMFEERVEAAAEGYDRQIGKPVFDVEVHRSAMRAALRAADAVEAEGQITEVIATVIETHKHTIGTHWPECWKYHAGCLAVLLRDMGVE